MKQPESTLNVGAEEFHPSTEENIVPNDIMEENVEIQPEGEEADSDADEATDGWRNEEAPGEHPRRVRRPRRIYTYDQLGHPSFQVLRNCSTREKGLPENHVNAASLSSSMYPFYSSAY